jgi:hypothetical protein
MLPIFIRSAADFHAAVQLGVFCISPRKGSIQIHQSKRASGGCVDQLADDRVDV